MKGNDLADIGVSTLVILLGILTLVYGITGVFLLDRIGDISRAVAVFLGGFAVIGGLDQFGVIND